ncbi:PAS/PAC sensor signal transduction histidine kinase [Hymenobacter roseosalivarius DSM 11622]|uniref:histidine kinase n=1 Tax=Hymenobacter roseosalivarius DSM 11622 TaxID=645990 RepID=A0A1W1VZT8_9BACT|nr:PAS domain-containing sensor histidine kinase [Hymenobacter roseosalivarius]SMB98879.1 PAS/PAC sensor signal transduction histidine kinase [Hymenobacter roseosalivarius DSM 11622]
MSEADDTLLPELDLRLTEENPEDLYEHAPCGYCSCLPDGTLIKLNQTLLTWLGYARQELVARLCLQQLFTIGGRLHYEMHCAPLLILQGQVREISYSLRCKDGTILPVLMNAVLRRDTDGNPLLIRVTLFDITDRRKYEQDLLRAKEEAEEHRELLQRQNEQLTRINADLDSFVYTASHDLKQPIHNMAGLLTEFKAIATFHDPEDDKMIGMFDQALQQILKTIEGLTEVVQRPRELEQAALEVVDLLPFTEEVIRSLQPREVKDVFTLDFATVPTLRIARTALQSILYNLLSNALKYAEPGRQPRIRVSTRLENEVPVLSVQDNGRGFDIERHGGQLFQLFRRFHPEVEGVGIGLYLVKRLVAQAGGQIEVESEVGQGTTFHLYLPQ